MDFDDWVKKYKPVARDFSQYPDNIEIGEDQEMTRFSHNDPKEWEFVQSQPEGHVWSIIETGQTTSLSLGFHVVDKTGYVVTEVAHDPADPDVVDYFSAEDAYDLNRDTLIDYLDEFVQDEKMSDDMASVIKGALLMKQWPSVGSDSMDAYCSIDLDEEEELMDRLGDIDELGVVSSDFISKLEQTLRTGELVLADPPVKAAVISIRSPKV